MATEAAPQEPVREQEKDEAGPAAAQHLPLSPSEKQYAKQPANIPRRIHIVGTGSIGKLVAHSLRGIPDPPPVSLVFHRGLLAKNWDESKRQITVKDGEYTVVRDGFDFELANAYLKQHDVMLRSIEDKEQLDVYRMSDETGLKPHEVAKIIAEQRGQRAQEKPDTDDVQEKDDADGQDTGQEELEGENEGRPIDDYVSSDPIHNLIVTTKTIRTVTALAALKHRITRDTTICFLQNGMGVIDAVNKEVFPDEATRPNYIQGIVSHGANVPPEIAARDPFYVVHAGHGTIALGVVPRKSLAQQAQEAENPPRPTGHGSDNDGKADDEHVEQLAASSRYMLRTLARTPVLAAVAFTPIELLQLQLEKLAINSILNPITSLLDNRNGTLNYNFPITRLKRLMLAETSLVIRSLPELRGLPNVPIRFSASRLEALTVNVTDKTKDNISSMLADIRAGRQTEIEYINGYIVKRGEESGIKCVVNYAIMQAVIAKSMMTQREYSDEVPVEGESEGLNRE